MSPSRNLASPGTSVPDWARSPSAATRDAVMPPEDVARDGLMGELSISPEQV
jgi:hypothetical protein